MMKRFFLEGAALVVAAVLCALVSNGLASRERKLALVGSYPNALKVPSQQSEPAGLPPVSSAPAVPPVDTATSSLVSPATTTSAPAATQTAPASTATAASTTTAPPTAKPTVTKPVAPSPAPAPAAAAKPDISRFQPHPDKAYLEIGYGDVAALHDAGALILDARRTSIYEQGHIAGARPFSVWESDIDQRVNALFDERGDPRQQALPIVVYCSGGECEDSHMLAQKLWGIQFNNVYVYRDGFPDWQKHGGAVRTGAQP